MQGKSGTGHDSGAGTADGTGSAGETSQAPTRVLGFLDMTALVVGCILALPLYAVFGRRAAAAPIGPAVEPDGGAAREAALEPARHAEALRAREMERRRSVFLARMLPVTRSPRRPARSPRRPIRFPRFPRRPARSGGSRHRGS